MPAQDDTARREQLLASLAQSREELRNILDPERTESDDDLGPGNHAAGGFPRSRTMQMLMSGRGLGTVAAVAGGLLIARPALALRLIRMVPEPGRSKVISYRSSLKTAPPYSLGAGISVVS